MKRSENRILTTHVGSLVRSQAAIDAVKSAAAGADNLVPPVIRAVEAQATIGEISDAMRSVFGEHEEIDV